VQRSRRLADYFGDPFPVADATFIVEQAEAFVAEINARFFSEPLADVP
jgi:hypothetical protein